METEQDWQAECDARTIADAEAIKADEKRFAKAQEAAKKILEAEATKNAALQRLAGAKLEYPKSPKG